MSKKLIAAGIAAGGTVVALLFGPNGPLGGFWRPIPLDPDPGAAQLAGLVGAGVVEAIGFGTALAVIVLGRPLFARLTRTPGLAQMTTAWLLGSWWPHSALHMHFGPRAEILVGLELIFHAGSIIAFTLLLWTMIPAVTTDRARTEPAAGRRLPTPS